MLPHQLLAQVFNLVAQVCSLLKFEVLGGALHLLFKLLDELRQGIQRHIVVLGLLGGLLQLVVVEPQ